MKTGRKLEDEIIEFFRRNPGEELTYDDAVIKFEAQRRRVQEAVSKISGLRAVHVIRVVFPEDGIPVMPTVKRAVRRTMEE